jgi:hypothetical protein
MAKKLMRKLLTPFFPVLDILWNKQYLLEAFLSCNNEFVVIGALNYLKTHFPDNLNSRLPVLKNNPDQVPGSFWIKKEFK